MLLNSGVSCAELEEVCSLFGCDCDHLIDALSHRTVKTSTESVKMDLSSTEVSDPSHVLSHLA